MPRGAGVAELADALDSKSGSRKGVGVRAPPPVPNSTHHPHIERSGMADLAMAQEIMRRVPTQWITQASWTEAQLSFKVLKTTLGLYESN